MITEALRSALYPFGFLSSIAFGSRFLVQWYASERQKRSVVPKAFWYLSFSGNLLLFLHTLIQIQFPMCLLNSLHMVLAWRNLNLMGSHKKPLKMVFILLGIAALVTTSLFILQDPETWIRPAGIGKQTQVPGFVHLIGTLGIGAFSLRFWIQWWKAEQAKASILPPIFWWISLFGAVLASSYFLYLKDIVNLVGPSIALIPYIRNLQLLAREKSSEPLFCVVATEPSGDLIASKIILKLKQRHPYMRFVGVTGPKLTEAGVETLFDMQKLRVMGLSGVLLKLPTIWSCFRKLKQVLKQYPNATLLCVDSPSFSLRLAKSVRKSGFKGKIIQMVAPSVWAWGEKRVDAFAKYFNLLLTLYSFEPAYFANSSLKTLWVGHPMVENLQKSLIPREKLIALFPGSRPKEIKKNLKLQLQAVQLALKELEPHKIAVSLAPGLTNDEQNEITETIKSFNLEADLVPEKDRYTLMSQASGALAKSGTVTLELALHETEAVVTYRMNQIDYLFIKYILKPKISLFSLPNIISGKKLFSEHIYPPVSPAAIAQDLIRILKNKTPASFETVRQGCTPAESPITQAVLAIEEEF